jgi:WD40 repeat protein
VCEVSTQETCVHTLIQAGVSNKWIYDSQRFLLEFFDVIHKSPSWVYHFALPFCPPSSWICGSYTSELSREVKVVKGPLASWGTCFRTVALEYIPGAFVHWRDVIAVGCYHKIVILDGITGAQVAVLSGHTNYVRSLSFSSDGTLLVSGSDDMTLKLWDVQTGGVVKTFHGHTDSIHSVSISSNCTTIASGSNDKTVHLWDIQTGECYCIIAQQQCVKCVSFSPTNTQHLISVSGGVVQWWDVSGCKIGPAYNGYYAAFSLDSSHFAVCGERVTSVWNSDSGVLVAECPTALGTSCCCFSLDGKLVAVAAGATAYIWDITNSHPHLIETFIGHTDTIRSLTFSSSSLISMSTDESVKFWQIGTSSTELVANNPESRLSTSASIKFVSLQAESGIAITGDLGGLVKIWDISTGLQKASFQTPATGETLGDAQIIEGRLVVVWFREGRIHIWDTKKGEWQVVEPGFPRVKDLKISGDGSKVFLLAGKFIQAWSVWTGEPVGGVEFADESYLDLFRMGGSRMGLCFPNSLTLGWDFGISDSSPVPLPNQPSERLHVYSVGYSSRWYEGPYQVKDIVTGKEVFQLSDRYATP